MTKKHSRARYSDRQTMELTKKWIDDKSGKYIQETHSVDFNCSQEKVNKQLERIFNIPN
tara:strand:- start:177 stop:353 length:177 start_codon:yes stop_codon:yes gene_type:complete